MINFAAMAVQINIKNKKAKYEYELLDKFIAGIQLLGTEIKSIRNNKASIAEGFCTFVKDELYIRNMHIAEYANSGYVTHDPKRERKLLLNRQELDKLKKKLIKGQTIVPLKLFINDKGLAKLQIALAQGKKQHDKRHDLKEKDTKRQLDRVMKKYN